MNWRTTFTLAAATSLLFNSAGCGDLPEPAPEHPQFLSTSAEFKDEIVRYKIRRDRTRLAIRRLQQRKEAVVARLQELGVGSAADLISTPQRLAAQELRTLVTSIAQLQEHEQLYTGAIVLMEAKLRDLERRAIIRGSAPSEEELEAVLRVKLDLEDQLTPRTGLVEEIDFDKILARELPTPPASP